MNLERLYRQVADTVSKLDFRSIWPGFEPLKFALYDAEKCFYNGRYVEKTDAFCANTSIVYEGEQIAIWMADEETEISVLTSKIVHEMFHGFQTLERWSSWPDEIEALFRYEYNTENLSLRLRENELLLELLDRFDGDVFRELMSLRRLRSEKFPYQFSYEIRTEEIEGTANYVEWQVLKQLDGQQADRLIAKMRTAVTDPSRMFPIRITCYYTGALMINAMIGAGVYAFDTPERPVILSVLKDAAPSDDSFPGREARIQAVSDRIAAYNSETESIIRSATEDKEPVLRGPVGLGYVNVYDARHYKEYLTSTYFLMYRDAGEEKMIPGNFVIRMQDEKTIEAVYKWE